MEQNYGRRVQELLARPENLWLKGLSAEEAEALRITYEERYDQ